MTEDGGPLVVTPEYYARLQDGTDMPEPPLALVEMMVAAEPLIERLPRPLARYAPPSRVPFTAACPQCGRDCEWTAVLVDTRLGLSIYCDCP